jgi:ribosomal protein uL23
MIDVYKVIKYPLATEKSIRLMEAENKLVFVVDYNATKADVKKAIEELFKVKVASVNTLHSVKGDKRAYVTFSKETPAIDIATNLGIM